MSLWRFIGMISCTALIFGTSCAKSRIADVIALRLPAGYGVNPEGTEPLVSVNSSGIVVAAGVRMRRGVAPPGIGVRWEESDRPEVFKHLWPHLLGVEVDATHPYLDGPISRTEVRGAVAGTSSDFFNVFEYVEAPGPFGTGLEAEMWHRNDTVTHNQLPVCHAGTNASRLIEDVDIDGRVAITYVALGGDAVGFNNILPTDKKDQPLHGAPYAFVIEKSRCISFGRAIITRLRGDWAAGYRKYFDGRLGLYNFDGHYVGVRWRKRRLQELGSGVVLSISRQGVAVGATTQGGGEREYDYNTNRMVFWPGLGVYTDVDDHGNEITPHAILWTVSGGHVQLEDDALRSVAYDVSDDGTVVGSLQTRDGTYHAFRWKNGRLERLDDLPHPKGWQFEAAYAIEKNGTIVGSGRKNGVPVVFKFRY